MLMGIADGMPEFAIAVRSDSAVPRVVEVRMGGVSAPSLTDGFIYFKKPVNDVHGKNRHSACKGIRTHRCGK
jgi:hypothetical protein